MMSLYLQSVFTICNKVWYIRRALPGNLGIPHIKFVIHVQQLQMAVQI
jgi:hypothetical protein